MNIHRDFKLNNELYYVVLRMVQLRDSYKKTGKGTQIQSVKYRGKELGTAKELLVNTDDKIREVSAKSGFNDYRNFCKVFKKTVGETPQNYRKQCRTK